MFGLGGLFYIKVCKYVWEVVEFGGKELFSRNLKLLGVCLEK